MLDFGLLVNMINSNKVLWGMSMLMLNFGVRYVVADLGKVHEVILSHEITKKLIVISLFFVATRDILMSFLLTIAYIVVIDGVLHEKRRFCLVPKSILSSQTSQHNISKDDYMKAKNIITNYESNNTNHQEVNELTKKSLYLNYMNNIKMTNL
jgi:hypothetical protein